MRKAFLALLLAASVTPALAQEKTFELKLSHWVPPSHPLQKALEEWGASVEKESGGTNVQSSAPEVRDIIERGVADAVTFPWGSVLLFGIDKVTKYHIDSAFYVTEQGWVINKGKYAALSAAQKKVIDDHCTPEWSEKIAVPWADFEAGGRDKIRAQAGHELNALTPEQLAEWRKAAEPLYAEWAENARKAGYNPDTIMKDLKDSLAKYNSLY